MSSRVRLVCHDPIEAIPSRRKDSTLAILLAAQARGWELFYADRRISTCAMAWRGAAWRRCKSSMICGLGSRARGRGAELGAYDAILMRKDPPFDMEYVYSTSYWMRPGSRALVFNRPQGLRDMNEKVYTAWFSRVAARRLWSPATCTT